MLNIAHRGDARLHVENTLAAIDAALTFKADAIEIDVRRAKTGELVVFHDADLKRLTGFSHTISSLSLASIQAQRHGISTLDEVIRFVDQRVPLLIEVKEEETALDMLKMVQRFVSKGYKPLHLIPISSRHKALFAMRDACPHAPLGVNIHAQKPLHASLFTLKPYSINPDIAILTEALVHDIRAHNVPIYAWTIKTRADVMLCKKHNIEGIITDDLALLAPHS